MGLQPNPPTARPEEVSLVKMVKCISQTWHLEWGREVSYVVNTLGSDGAIRRTDYPGTENMVPPLSGPSNPFPHMAR